LADRSVGRFMTVGMACAPVWPEGLVAAGEKSPSSYSDTNEDL